MTREMSDNLEGLVPAVYGEEVAKRLSEHIVFSHPSTEYTKQAREAARQERIANSPPIIEVRANDYGGLEVACATCYQVLDGNGGEGLYFISLERLKVIAESHVCS